MRSSLIHFLKEINKIKKALYNRLENANLKKAKNIKRSTFKYIINIKNNEVNINNVKTKKAILKQLSQNESVVSYVYEYILKDSSYNTNDSSYSKENFIQDNIDKSNNINDIDFIISTGMSSSYFVNENSPFKGLVFAPILLVLDLSINIYFIKISAFLTAGFAEYSFKLANFKINYLFSSDKIYSLYTGIGFALMSVSDIDDDGAGDNFDDFNAMSLHFGTEIFRDKKYKISIESSLIFTLQEIKYYTRESKGINFEYKDSYYPFIVNFTIKVGFSLFGDKQSFCGCLF